MTTGSGTNDNNSLDDNSGEKTGTVNLGATTETFVKRKRRRGGVLRYPLEALTEHTDYLQIDIEEYVALGGYTCLLYTSPSPRDLSTSRMPSSA